MCQTLPSFGLRRSHHFHALAAVVLGLLLAVSTATAQGLPRIAVVDFDTHQYSADLAGAQLADYVMDELVNTGLFEVVEREKLSSVMNELGFAASGMVDSSGAAQMGRLLGARLLLTGRVVSLGQEARNFSGYGVNTRSTQLNLTVSIRITDVESGSIAFSTRTSSQRTINEAGGMSIRSSGAYAALAEQAANDVVAEVVRSGRFERRSAVVEAAPAMVDVAVTSSPPGADIEVDGIFYGNAGDTVSLPQGLRTVRISLAGYLPWEKKVMVNPGVTINASLAPVQ